MEIGSNSEGSRCKMEIELPFECQEIFFAAKLQLESTRKMNNLSPTFPPGLL